SDNFKTPRSRSPPEDTTVLARISDCLADISTLGVGDMTKIFYHGICNFISRLRYISRFIICRVTRFGFLKKRTLQRGEMCPQTFIYLPLRTLRCRNNTASIGYWPKQ